MKNKFHVEITPELIKRAQDRVDHILRIGCLRADVSEKFDSKIKPDWYDEERRTSNSALIGLFLVLQLPIGLVPLLATGQSKNVSQLFSRYLNTALHVRAWYKFDPFDPKSKAHKSQELVKSMHKNVGKLMNSKISIYDLAQKMIKESGVDEDNNNKIDIEKFIKNKDRIWASQADMALTQWAFIGVLILEPYACGLHGATKETLVEIAYLWKVFGYRIGIEDEFNFFDELDYELIYAMCKLILEQDYIPNMENLTSPMGYRMGHGMLTGMRPVMPSVRWKSYIKFWYKKLNINAYKLNSVKEVEGDKFEFVNSEIKTELTDEERKQMIQNGYNDKYIVPNPQIPFEELKLDTLAELFFYNYYRFNVNVTLKSSYFRNLSRKTNKGRMNKGVRIKKEHFDFLTKKYDEKNQFPACPFASDIQNPYFEYSDVNKTDTNNEPKIESNSNQMIKANV